MGPSPRTPRHAAGAQSRSRAGSSANGTRRTRESSIVAATEPPLKRRRFIPSGSVVGEKLSENNEDAPNTVGASLGRNRSRQNPGATNNASPSVYPRRERSTRIRISTRAEPDDEMQISSAAAVAAAVVQSEGYKPREERGWEEFHPNLDIDATFIMFHAEDVDGTARSAPGTPYAQTTGTERGATPSQTRDPNAGSANNTPAKPGTALAETPGGLPGTPTRSRRTVRAPRDTFYGTRSELGIHPKTPTVLPIHNQTPKERLDLKQPQYRKTNRILLFESKKFGQARYVDKAMMNVGYQESDDYIRPDRRLITASDATVEDDAESSGGARPDGEISHPAPNSLGRVEYDMDEQDDMWLETYNAHRKSQGLNPITREIFEITITKIEKEWHALEKRIPKPNPKPPQTHRPRSSSAAAVNGEPQAGEEQDSKCAICDDGDCENTNAIVFCDGCDLAVHQECYGVPFIPEGQWLCRKCQLIGRGVPTCIFCPNSDGAFKQTNSSKWAHLLCAMWIPEVSLGNHTFMEPVMDVEKVPKSRWKLSCYICNQQMGACIQCGNKSCYQAFHVTCARRARLFLRMKNSSGALDVLDGSTNLKALCDKHCPSEYAKTNDVVRATRRAKKFYKKTMNDRIWANNQASAMVIAASHRNATTEHPPDESQMTGAKLSALLGDKKGQPGKSIWKLPSGAPVIPQTVFEIVEASLQRFTFLKRRDFVSDACRYWTLKREMRRGAALLKRLQLQMETFSSMELTRRNFASMGPVGKARLERRIEFAQSLIHDLEQLKTLSQGVVDREHKKLEAAEMEQEFVDTCYFPIHKFLPTVVDKCMTLDKNVFQKGLLDLQDKVEERHHTTTLAFTQDLCKVIHIGINTSITHSTSDAEPNADTLGSSATKQDFSDIRERKRLGKRIMKAVQPQLENALQLEAEIGHKSFENLKLELESMAERCLEVRQITSDGEGEQSQDVIMVDSGAAVSITVERPDETEAQGDIAMADAEGETEDADAKSTADDAPEDTNDLSVGGNKEHDTASVKQEISTGEVQAIDTPPATNGYMVTKLSSQAGPPTPPQSIGSLGRQASDILTDGGVPWYLKEFDPQGTSAIQEEGTCCEETRSVSEALTEMDDDELKGLGVEINEGSITTSPAHVNNKVETSIAAATTTASPMKRAAKPRKRKATTYRRR